jgi:hypothetical protein
MAAAAAGCAAMVAESICECGWGLVMGWESEGGREGGRAAAATAEGVGGTEGYGIAPGFNTISTVF